MSASSRSAGVTLQPQGLAVYRRKAFSVVVLLAISLAGACVLTERLHPGRMDYIEYWSSGTLLLHRLNPYSPNTILALEKAHGYLLSAPLIMPNPPWALFLVLPLGPVGVHLGLFLWTLIAAACILLSVHLLNPRSNDNSLALLFAPAIACFGSGQSSPFLLFGFSLFLRFHRSQPFLAGASLLLMAIKPHLFLVFWAVLLLDCLYRRGFGILAGAFAALTAGTLIAMCFDLRIWRHYLAMLHEHHPAEGFIPTLSMMFRILIDVRQFWILFVPSGFAVVWGIYYYHRHRHLWDWRVQGMLLMLVTVLASPYGFFTDEIVLLPSIIFALNHRQPHKNAAWLLLAINAIAAIIFMTLGASLTSPAYLWTPVAWLAWFLYATDGVRQIKQHPRTALADSVEARQAGF